MNDTINNDVINLLNNLSLYSLRDLEINKKYSSNAYETFSGVTLDTTFSDGRVSFGLAHGLSDTKHPEVILTFNLTDYSISDNISIEFIQLHKLNKYGNELRINNSIDIYGYTTIDVYRACCLKIDDIGISNILMSYIL